jgi:predicted NUDIX family NTP pyrophosphohydrolase
MPLVSAGILLYRRRRRLEVLVAHPGGPFWADKDEGAWSIPKGLAAEGEAHLDAAQREFEEEIGSRAWPPGAAFTDLGSTKLRSGKTVCAWAVEGDCDAASICSNTFAVQWPPRSGTWIRVPEVDRAGWFEPAQAKRKLNPAQGVFVDRLVEALGAAPYDADARQPEPAPGGRAKGRQ